MNFQALPLPNSPETLPIDEIFKTLDTNPKGLSSEEAKKRLKLFGKNQLEEEKISAIAIFFRQFKSIIIYVLLIASMISLFLNAWIDFLIIFFVVILNSVLGFWQEFKAEHSIQALKKLTESRVRVKRNGELITVLSSEIVPGDCVYLKEGEIVTADVRLFEDTSLLIDESSMTGESVPVGKDSTALLPDGTPIYDQTNMALAGTLIVRGEGKGIVVRTGSSTYFGKIAKKAVERSPETQLTKALNYFAKWFVLQLCALFFLFFIIGFFQGRSIPELAYILIASLVSAIPEGLPLVITLVVVIGAITLAKKKTYVRVLPSVETLGSATVIASDKTGTITEGKLQVREWKTRDLDKLQLVSALCNDVHQGLGDPIDLALWNWVKEAENLKARFRRVWSYPFDSKAMLTAAVHEIEGKELLLIKGAYESIAKLSAPDAEFEAAHHELLKKGYRVLAFGIGDWKAGQEEPQHWKVQLIGVVGFLDPAKEGVKEAVMQAKNAHIRPLMLTGDHLITAHCVAEEVGIWQPGDEALTGTQIEKMSDEELKAALKNTTILARILPDHKYRIVKLLQEMGEVVAVTGDGVNDVPALKAADLGIAMGNGTEAAKSVSEMVIMDNSFDVIVEAIKTGRVIANNLRKAIYYLVSTSIMEIFLISFSIFALLPLPLSAVQILWINLVTSGVQVQSYAFIREEGDVMRRPPKRPSEKFIDRSQIFRILYFGFGLGLMLFLQYLYLRGKYPAALVSTVIFTSSTMAQLANGLQAQKENEPFFKNIRSSFTINPYIFPSFAGGVALQVGAIYLFPVQFKVVPLNAALWIFPIGTFLFSFAFVELRKWVENWRTCRREPS